MSPVAIIMRLGHLLDPGGQLSLPDRPGARVAGWESKPGMWFRHSTASSVDAAVGALADKMVETARLQQQFWGASLDATLRSQAASLRLALREIDGESCEHCGADGGCAVCRGAA